MARKFRLVYAILINEKKTSHKAVNRRHAFQSMSFYLKVETKRDLDGSPTSGPIVRGRVAVVIVSVTSTVSS